MGVGIIDHESGTRDIRLLNGMRKVFLKCILSCCSLHYLWQVFLFKWLLSKEMFLDSLTKANELDQYGFVLTFVIISIGVIASILTFTYALYMIKKHSGEITI